jgi:enoyl-CoA hydratase/carnithine racemase
MSGIFAVEMDEGLAVVTFDVPGDAVNTWTDEALRDFTNTIEDLEGRKRELRGIIFISGKANNFHAGANLNFITGSNDPEKLDEALSASHRDFLKMERLGVPTLAAINGACMGGGYELALAMTARIATDSRRTLIGLPECNVGLFPGAGGTQRMPRLIGTPAIELILKGATLPPVKAMELGMIDRVLPEGEDLLEAAKVFMGEILAGKAGLKREKHDFSDLDTAIDLARQAIRKATRGRALPAHTLALRAMEEGLRVSLEDSLAVEQKYFKEVVATPESKGSINTFFLKTTTDKPASMLPRDFKPRPIRKIAMLGFGTMGRGIVIDILRRMQVPVVVKDLPEALGPGQEFVRKILQDMADKGRLKAPVDGLCDLIRPVSEWTDDF